MLTKKEYHFMKKWAMKCRDPVNGFPCGRCEYCLSKKRNQWTIRLGQEVRTNISTFFVTLTYDDDHIPEGGNGKKEDVQKFLKRIRKHQEVRYFAVSEYGEEFDRIHYHLLFFINEYKKVEEIEELVTKCWKFGITDVKLANPARIHYITKYVMKKLDNNTTEFDKPFMLCSRKPLIGYKWYADNDHIDYCTYNGNKFALPKSYRYRRQREEEKKLIAMHNAKDNDFLKLSIHNELVRERAITRQLEYNKQFNFKHNDEKDNKEREYRQQYIGNYCDRVRKRLSDQKQRDDNNKQAQCL